ncbi:BQ2448_6501 [Microbotryum intermedium]|uniref:4-nitrophenylphosphatase n=1 Tax=Microbotryum intermedium TaxID=269621 RepID=A0A238FMP7_9BASI|nr:BQ2448_6501 [Microbotryum intermedium]
MPRYLTTQEDLEEIVDKYDTILFDCDGVIWEGDHLIPHVKEVLAGLRKKGKRFFFVTNNATKSRESNKAKFDKLGIECHVDDIFSSAYASATYLKNVLNFPADKKVYVIGEKGIEDELDSVEIRHSGGTDPADNVFIDLMDFSSITPDPEVGAVLCGLDMHLNYKKIAKGCRYLRENEGCHFVATNLDSTFPTHGSVCPGKSGGGATIAPLITTLGRQPLVIGKPEAAMLESILKTSVLTPATSAWQPLPRSTDLESVFFCLRSYDLDKSKMLMVGDRLNTDILFGVNGGISTMLVLTGINTRAEAEAEDAIAKPTYIVESLGDFSSVV